MKTDNQLKQALAKMLPERIVYQDNTLYWQYEEVRHDRPVMNLGNRVLDTELLHLCWLVEQQLMDDNFSSHASFVLLLTSGKERYDCYSASWQQRTLVLAKVKGITI